MSDLEPCPFLVRMCSMDGQIIGYTCKGECANCPAEDAKDREIERLKAALKRIAYYRDLNPGMKATEFAVDVESELRNFYCTMGDIAKTALSKAPDTGKMEG